MTKPATRSTRRPPHRAVPIVRGAPEPDLSRARRLVLELLSIPGPSCQEGAIAAAVTRHLLDAGYTHAQWTHDDAHRRTPRTGEVGNLSLKLPGTLRGPRRLLMAHLDTVPLCVGATPRQVGSLVQSAHPHTGLGADDRAGVAVLLHTALELRRQRLPHPPLVFLWLVQEEIGLYGARFARTGRLGRPRLAFNWDGGAAHKLTVGATGAFRLEIDVFGRASHAGGAPEQGVSAIGIAGLAIAELVRDGWHGAITHRNRQGTCNIGFIQGGAATNVVTDLVQLRAEARSHDPQFRRAIVRRIQQAFRRAARAVRASDGATGRVQFVIRQDYESFVLATDEPCVLEAEAAVRDAGLEPFRAISNGGLDANWMTAHGIPTVTLGCGQQNPHTVQERLDLTAFEQACRIALRLATATTG